MALINGVYIHVVDESVDRSMQMSEHSVETGVDVTDHVKPEAVELSLSGYIVSYTNNISESNTEQKTIKAWLSLVKKDGSAFDTMSFERLHNELLTFYGGTYWADTGAIQYIDENGDLINCNVEENSKIYAVKFELDMPYAGTVRIQNAYKEYCCFNIINKNTTGYNVRDYDADSADINEFVLSNTYNGESGRIRTEFTNYDIETTTLERSEEKSAAWVIECLRDWMNSGTLVTYEGRNYIQNYLIKSFQSEHPNEVTGGAKFSMTLKEFRGALNSYNGTDGSISSGGTQQISQGENTEVWYEVQIGDNMYDLISQYSGLKRSPINGVEYTNIDWIMQKNPDAFDDITDCSTLRACTKILMGYR